MTGAPAPVHVHPARIIRWIDADTVVLSVQLDYFMRGEPLRHRMVWINAYEKRTPEGKEAAAYVNRVAPAGSEVTVRSFKQGGQEDDFGRWLAEIFVGDLNLNQELLRLGYAVPFMT
jgi:endonuclease YncB( thermonuclease family)